MVEGTTVAAIDGWYTLDREQPHLIGTQCSVCGTFYFPRVANFCRNPACEGTDLREVQLSRTGKVWSYTNASYKPPEPFVAVDPFEPFAIAAVELEKEQMIVLGQVVKGIGVENLSVGMTMELVLETLYVDGDKQKVIWKWKPVVSEAGQ